MKNKDIKLDTIEIIYSTDVDGICDPDGCSIADHAKMIVINDSTHKDNK